MKKNLLAVFIIIVFLTQLISAQNIPDGYEKIKELGGIEEYKLLSNDLNVLLMEDHSAPVLTFMVTYHVGSRNEVIGTTGATHILEHLMFKGTPTFNKKIGTSIPSTLQNIGAVMNATTWLDRTNYFENIPNDQLELAVHLESDRMRNSLLNEDDKNSEMTVVRNEFEQGENDPSSALDKEIWAASYLAHPYHHSTIGWRSDIENVPIEKLRDFYNTFYWPNNATVTLIGDFEKSNALELINKYFGAISRSPHEIPAVYTEEPEQQGQRRVIVKRPGQLGVVGVSFRSPAGLSPDTYPLLVFENILTSGKTSRLYKRIVDTNMGVSQSSWYSPFKDPGIFPIYVTLAAGTTHDTVEKAVFEELEKIKTEGVTQEEIDRAISQIQAATYYRRDGSFSVAGQINEAIAMGDWTYYLTYPERIGKVTADDVKKIANKYFTEDQSVVGYFIPKSPDEKTAESSGTENKIQTGPSESEMSLLQQDNSSAQSTNEREVKREMIAGIDVLSVKTGVQDVITFTGSFVAGDYYSPKGNLTIADLTGRMLDKGTVKNDKFAIAEKLANMGADIDFSVSTHTVNFNGKCLKKDVKEVVDLLAEQLRYPAFNEQEFEKLKTQLTSSMKRTLENTNAQAFNEMNRILFPEGHPNYADKTEDLIRDIKTATLDQVKDFYKNYYGPKSMILVTVGDLDSEVLNEAIKNSFDGWQGGVESKTFEIAQRVKGQKSIVTLPGKSSTTLLLGFATQLDKTSPDYLPLYVGTYILGGNFSARLMSTVRDNEGLTYGINSWIGSDTYSDGAWFIRGDFNPSMLEQGLQSTMREVNKWAAEGITAEELANKKSTITGQFKVQLAKTSGLANQLLSFLQRGYDADYIDEYPKLIENLTLEQINGAIKKYVNTDNIVTVMCGSIDEKGQPLSDSK